MFKDTRGSRICSLCCFHWQTKHHVCQLPLPGRRRRRLLLLLLAAAAAGGIDEVGVQRPATWGRHVGTAGSKRGWTSTLRLNSMLWSVAREWDGVPPKTIRGYPCHQYRSVAGAALPCARHDPFPMAGSWLVERDQLATAPCPLSRSQIPVFQTLDQAISPCAQRRLY